MAKLGKSAVEKQARMKSWHNIGRKRGEGDYITSSTSAPLRHVRPPNPGTRSCPSWWQRTIVGRTAKVLPNAIYAFSAQGYKPSWEGRCKDAEPLAAYGGGERSSAQLVLDKKIAGFRRKILCNYILLEGIGIVSRDWVLEVAYGSHDTMGSGGLSPITTV